MFFPSFYNIRAQNAPLGRDFIARFEIFYEAEVVTVKGGEACLDTGRALYLITKTVVLS